MASIHELLMELDPRCDEDGIITLSTNRFIDKLYKELSEQVLDTEVSEDEFVKVLCESTQFMTELPAGLDKLQLAKTLFFIYKYAMERTRQEQERLAIYFGKEEHEDTSRL